MKIAYIMSRFPHLPETFILREMIEMEQLGWEIELYPLILQKQSVVHPSARALVSRAHKLPFLSFALILANIRSIFSHPIRYFRLAARVIWENRTSIQFLARALVIFPKSVQMAYKMRQEGVQHIHAHYATHPALAAWIIHHLTGIPYSITVHAHDIFIDKTMLTTKLRDAVFIVAISEFNRNYLASHAGEWVREKIRVIHCGVFPEDYSSRTGPVEGTFEILTTGSLQPYKGQKFLIEACGILQARSIPIHCSIIGGGDLMAELSGQISTLGLEKMVTLCGPRTQEEVASLLTRANCYVQPSIITSTGMMEGIPVSIMEAMVCSIPVVATSISGIPELVQDDKTGKLVPPENAAALADAIEFIYRDQHTASQLAQNARELILQEFNLHRNVQQLSLLMNSSTYFGK